MKYEERAKRVRDSGFFPKTLEVGLKVLLLFLLHNIIFIAGIVRWFLKQNFVL